MICFRLAITVTCAPCVWNNAVAIGDVSQTIRIHGTARSYSFVHSRRFSFLLLDLRPIQCHLVQPQPGFEEGYTGNVYNRAH